MNLLTCCCNNSVDDVKHAAMMQGSSERGAELLIVFPCVGSLTLTNRTAKAHMITFFDFSVIGLTHGMLCIMKALALNGRWLQTAEVCDTNPQLIVSGELHEHSKTIFHDLWSAPGLLRSSSDS
ncbi:hypothetical protein NC653_030069 [Populus alba x Populus x berolinensis]|uniref:Uncharacterized protein n=1 Tax=Populus alba x Populus x berolinensis TaxID=444605 RepID=A0AAD6LV82_9ROSI|nr:hypothetical protein NC653_030069 [Populus alba x Populus x berolinensis]